MKTVSAAKKRFRKTGKGKVKAAHAYCRHMMTKKSPNVKRGMRKTLYLCAADLKHIDVLLPY